MKGWEEKRLRRHWRKLHIKNWMLILLLVFGIFSSAYFLRQNNLKMVELRNEVVVADERGKGLEQAIENLNHHVFHHMNTEIVRPVELVNTYNRQARAAIEAANRGSGRDIYAEATRVCERRGVPLASIAQCTAEYAANNNPDVGPKQIALPDKSRFTYSFSSPRWTPDLAGFSLLFTGAILIWILVRLLEFILVTMIVRRRLKNNF